MDVNFTLLIMALASIFIGHVTKQKIWNLVSVPIFFYLMVEFGSDSILLAVGFAFAMIIVLLDTFIVRGND